ncbi:hypothetical protein QTP88_025020 [Uroleucon formosanum]
MNSGKYSNTLYDNNIGSCRSKSECPHESHDCIRHSADHIRSTSASVSATTRSTISYCYNNYIFKMSPPKSKCWMYFKKVDKFIAQCKICSQNIKYCGNTSNLAKHLKKHSNILEPGTSSTTKTTAKHLKLTSTPITNPVSTQSKQTTETSHVVLSKTVVQDTESETEGCVDDPNLFTEKSVVLKRPIIDAFNRISSYAEGGFNHRKITMCLLYFICKDYRPFAVVEGEGFKRLIKELAPAYKIPSVITLKNTLDNKYEVTKGILKSCLLAAPHVSITFDAWTETMNEKSFLGVTVHYLKDVSLKSHCLAVAELKERHTAQYLSDIIQKILSDWQIDNSKIVTVVTDNGANVVSAVNRIFGKSRHTPCFAHTINLVATHTVGQQNIKPIISKVREIVKWVKNSVINSDQLIKKQTEAGVPEGKFKKLILDVATRWNSIFFMIRRFLEMVSFLSPILLNDITAPSMPTAIEMNILRQLLELLQPLEFVTKESSGENYITISKVIPMISCLLKQLAQIQPRFDVLSDIKDVLHAEIVRRFGLIEQVKPIAIATILDPRFKNLHFSDPVACSSAMAELRKLSKPDITSSESEGEVTTSLENEESYDFWAHHKMLAHGQKKKKSSSFANDELSLYLSNPVSPLKSNPLELWEDMKTVFPMLYKQSRISFTMVATSVPSERLFSKAGGVMTKTRNRLTGSRLEKILLLADLPEDQWF